MLKNGLLFGSIVVMALTALARGILPCMVNRYGLTNEQIDDILTRHPDAQLRITAQDWRAMRYQLHRFGNMTNYVEQIGNSNDCAKVLLHLHDVGEELKGSRFSVPEKMDLVLDRARREGQVSFVSLFAEDAPKGEIIVTFLALLELLRQHRVIVYQNAAFHEITILPSREEPDDKPLERPDDYE